MTNKMQMNLQPYFEKVGEDLNEIKSKIYVELYRNNSIITYLYCGLNKSIIKSPLFRYKSIAYNPFTRISLLIPNRDKIKINYLNF